MALIDCPECGIKVSYSVNACIHCGFTFKIQKLQGKIMVYGHQESFLISPVVKVYIKGQIVGEIRKGGLLEIDIYEDTIIIFKYSFRSTQFVAPKDTISRVRLSFDRYSGGLEAKIL